MIIALGFCHKDYLSAEKLFRWMVELSGQEQHHTLLLMASSGMKPLHISIVERAAKDAFAKVHMRITRLRDERGWPMSANTLFMTSYHEVQRLKHPYFLWIESDCVPLKDKWIDSLEGEYVFAGKPFMGCVYQHPFPHLTGCAIYPNNIEAYNPVVVNSHYEAAWDIIKPELTLPNTHHTEQFQHEWGNHKHNIAPSFPNHASMKLIRDDAVLFHRCKDGTLIDRLRDRINWPKYCKVMSLLGNPSNRFQDFEDHDWSQVKFEIT